MASPVEVIQATLAPAFLVTGSSIFLNFTQTRLFRVIDRIRAQGDDESARPALLRRARLLRNAIALGVLTVAMTVLCSILLMAGGAWGIGGASDLAPAAFALAMVSLFAALCLTLWDTILSVRNAERPAGPR